MADREHLHALVDSLPEGALESAQTYLQAIQIWPPKEPEYPPEVEQHRKELEAKRDKFLKSWAVRPFTTCTTDACGSLTWDRTG